MRASGGARRFVDHIQTDPVFVLLIFTLPATFAAFKPGDAIKGFTVDTLNGKFEVDASHATDSLALLFVAYDPEDASSRYMWQDPHSVQSFIKAIPRRVHCLFFSYSGTAKADVLHMNEILQHSLEDLQFSPEQQHRFLMQMHFAVASVAETGSWLQGLLAEWTSPRKVITGTAGQEWNMTTERLDSAYGWLPPPDGLQPASLQLLPSPCQHAQGDSYEGSIALALLTEADQNGQQCSLAEVVRNAQDAKATAVIVAAAKGSDVTLIDCQGSECTWPLSIPATMIGFDAGERVKEQLLGYSNTTQLVEVSFQEQQVPGFYAGVDNEGRLIELGWSKWPTLMHLAWQGQWQVYLDNLKANLSRPALTVPVFVNQNMSGPGIDADITLPPLQTLQAHDTFELDLQLSCPGTRDKDCPVWDHTVQLFVCCEDPKGKAPPCGGSCSPTVWAQPSPAEGSEKSPSRQLGSESKHGQRSIFSTDKGSEGGSDAPLGKGQCGRELGRWITPFRRRIGRWLTDVTPLLPLLTSQQCHFHLQTAPWALTWAPSLTFRFTNRTSQTVSSVLAEHGQPLTQTLPSGLEGGHRRLVPSHIIPLFGGGLFDADYNRKYKPVTFQVPEGSPKVMLEAVVTGHGYDNNQCAEFCPTSHHFIVNGVEHMLNFTEAATPWGCADKVLEGSEPNEHGTWQYGRGGWCDGQEVRPWVIDISSDVSPYSASNVITYHGWYQGKDPVPTGEAGFIMMESNLVFYTVDMHMPDIEAARAAPA